MRKSQRLEWYYSFRIEQIKRETAGVDKIYKILDEFNVKLDYIQSDQ